MDYRRIGQQLVTNNPDARTVCTEIEGRNIWFKQPVPPKARVWHFLQKGFSLLIPRPILRATVSKGGAAALRAEAARLVQFKEAGFHVPDVLAVHDDMIVMTDAGPQFRAALDTMPDYESRLMALKKAIRTMAALHKAGLPHGRPYMRDMTWDDEKLGFLDLEEDPLKVMPLHTAQARDVWIFLSAASRYALKNGCKKTYEGNLAAELYAEYAKDAAPETLAELESFVRFLSPLRKLLDRPLLWDHIGRDVRQSIYVNRCLEAYLKR